MNDYLDQPLNVGDKVVLIEPNYRNFIKSTITKFTNMFVFVEFDTNYRTLKSIKQDPHQLIKIN